MGMVISGSGIDSAACRELRAKLQGQLEKQDDLDAIVRFETQDAFIEFQQNGQTMTPYLTLLGRPMAVEADFPYGVSGVEYSEQLDQALVAYRYELNRQNIADMAMKGMFEDGFQVPDVVRKNQFELPCTVSCVAVPAESSKDFPVVFASINPGSLVCDDDMSGYTIHEYFEAMPEREPDDLMYESAVAKMLPYERVLKQASERIAEAVPMDVPEPVESEPVVQEESAGAPEVHAETTPVVDTFSLEGGQEDELEPELEPDSEPEFEPEFFDEPEFVEEPDEVETKPAAKKVDRQAAVEEMGGPESGEEGFFSLDDGDNEFD